MGRLRAFEVLKERWGRGCSPQLPLSAAPISRPYQPQLCWMPQGGFCRSFRCFCSKERLKSKERASMKYDVWPMSSAHGEVRSASGTFWAVLQWALMDAEGSSGAAWAALSRCKGMFYALILPQGKHFFLSGGIFCASCWGSTGDASFWSVFFL